MTYSVYNIQVEDKILFPTGITGSKVLSVNVDGTTSWIDQTGTPASSYTATSLPVFENNTSASSLAVDQFYRTSTGVLMVKF